MQRLKGKVALITGATGGLGSGIASVLASEGAKVAVNYIDVGDLRLQAQELVSELKGDHKAYAADITNEGEVSQMVRQIVEDFGRIDVLVNNAGISINHTTWNYPLEDWNKVIAVNLTGAFICSKHALPYMREQNYGRIICISSVVGTTGAKGTVAYGASKAGLIGMCKTIARETAAKGITANCIAPGYIDAGIMRDVPDKFRDEQVLPGIPMGRLGDASDIAAAVAYLASDDGKYITGQVFCVDGGFAM